MVKSNDEYRMEGETDEEMASRHEFERSRRIAAEQIRRDMEAEYERHRLASLQATNSAQHDQAINSVNIPFYNLQVHDEQRRTAQAPNPNQYGYSMVSAPQNGYSVTSGQQNGCASNSMISAPQNGYPVMPAQQNGYSVTSGQQNGCASNSMISAPQNGYPVMPAQQNGYSVMSGQQNGYASNSMMLTQQNGYSLIAGQQNGHASAPSISDRYSSQYPVDNAGPASFQSANRNNQQAGMAAQMYWAPYHPPGINQYRLTDEQMRASTFDPTPYGNDPRALIHQNGRHPDYTPYGYVPRAPIHQNGPAPDYTYAYVNKVADPWYPRPNAPSPAINPAFHPDPTWARDPAYLALRNSNGWTGNPPHIDPEWYDDKNHHRFDGDRFIPKGLFHNTPGAHPPRPLATTQTASSQQPRKDDHADIIADLERWCKAHPKPSDWKFNQQISFPPRKDENWRELYHEMTGIPIEDMNARWVSKQAHWVRASASDESLKNGWPITRL